MRSSSNYKNYIIYWFSLQVDLPCNGDPPRPEAEQRQQHLQWNLVSVLRINDNDNNNDIFSGLMIFQVVLDFLVFWEERPSPAPSALQSPLTQVHHPHFQAKESVHFFYNDSILIRPFLIQNYQLCWIYRPTIPTFKQQNPYILILSSKSPALPSNILNIQGWKEMAVEQNPKVQVI